MCACGSCQCKGVVLLGVCVALTLVITPPPPCVAAEVSDEPEQGGIASLLQYNGPHLSEIGSTLASLS